MPFGGLLTASLVSAGSSILGGVLGSRAASQASDAQALAAKYAADLQAKTAAETLQLQREQFQQQQTNIQPWIDAGRGGLAQLARLLEPGGQLTQPFKYAGGPFRFDPSRATEDQGFAFRLAEGQKALERSAAARGSALGGGTLRSLARYAQEYSSNEYQNAWNRAMGEYNTNFSNAFNTFQSNQGNLFNRLAALSGIGQQGVSLLSNAGNQFATNATNTMMQSAQHQGDFATQAANARASGYIGRANAWSNALSGAFNPFVESLAYGNLLRRIE